MRTVDSELGRANGGEGVFNFTARYGSRRKLCYAGS